MTFPNRADLAFWRARKYPRFAHRIDGNPDAGPSIHAVIRGRSPSEKGTHHAENTVSLVRQKARRLGVKPSSVVATLAHMGTDCPADPRRKVRAVKWWHRIHEDRTAGLLGRRGAKRRAKAVKAPNSQ